MRGTLALVVLSNVLLSGGCVFKVEEPPLEGRPCDQERRCLPGYLCREGTCQAVPVGDDCDLTSCAPGFCWTAIPGESFCTYACASSGDCPSGTRCVEGDPGKEGALVCVPELLLETSVGDGVAGDPCTGPGECRSGICNEAGRCSDTCQDDVPCHPDSTDLECRVVAIGGRQIARCMAPIPKGGHQGEICGVEGRTCAVGVCMEDPLDPPNARCADPCCSTAQCPENAYCWLGWEGWTPGNGLVRSCYPLGGQRGAGAFADPCGSDADCATFLCWLDPVRKARACTDTCCTDADCPQGYRCQPQVVDVDGDGTGESYVPICVAIS